FFSSRRRHTISKRDWSSDVCSSDLIKKLIGVYSEPDSQVFTYPNGRVVHFITTCFLAEITGGELRCNSSESQEIQFFEQQSLPRDLLKMHPQWLNDALANDDLAFIRQKVNPC